MELFVLRHAIAEDHSASGRDSDRKLTDEGIEKMKRIAKGMKAAKLSFDLILSSPYVRAKETADIVAKVFDAKERLKLSAALMSGGDSQRLIDELSSDHRKHESILIVGHEPDLSRLISILISGQPDTRINLKKGGLCKLSAEALKHARCATLEWLLTPGQMGGWK
jgi:phosphohistidine phosphatase